MPHLRSRIRQILEWCLLVGLMLVVGWGGYQIARPAPTGSTTLRLSPPRSSDGPRDTEGQPLPPGALARLGSRRWMHGPPIERIVFSGDGARLVTADARGSLCLWETASGKLLDRFSIEALRPETTAASSDGQQVAVSLDKGQILLWQPERQQAELLEGHREADLLRMARAVRKHLGLTVHPARDWACSLAFFPDGKTLVSGGADGHLRFWNTASGSLLVDAQGHAGPVERLAVSADGQRLASGGVDGRVRIWTPSGTRAGPTFRQAGAVRVLRLSNDGSQILAGGWDPDAEQRQELLWLDVETMEPVRRERLPSQVTPDRWGLLDDGQRLWWANRQSQVSIGPLTSAAQTTPVLFYREGSMAVGAMAPSPDGGLWAAADPSKPSRLLLQPVTASGLGPPVDDPQRQTDLAFSIHGPRLATVGGGRHVEITSLESGEVLSRWSVPGALFGLTFLADDTTLSAWHIESPGQAGAEPRRVFLHLADGTPHEELTRQAAQSTLVEVPWNGRVLALVTPIFVSESTSSVGGDAASGASEQAETDATVSPPQAHAAGLTVRVYHSQKESWLDSWQVDWSRLDRVEIDEDSTRMLALGRPEIPAKGQSDHLAQAVWDRSQAGPVWMRPLGTAEVGVVSITGDAKTLVTELRLAAENPEAPRPVRIESLDMASGQLLGTYDLPAGVQVRWLQTSTQPPRVWLRWAESNQPDAEEQLAALHLPELAVEFTLGSPEYAVAQVGVVTQGNPPLFALARRPGHLVLMDSPSGGLLRELEPRATTRGPLTFSQDGQHLLLGDNSGVVAIWECASGRLVAQYEAHRGAILRVQTLPNDWGWLTAGDDGTALLWKWPIRPPTDAGDQPEAIPLEHAPKKK